MFAMEMQKAAVDSQNTQIIKLSWVYCAINMVGFLSRFSKLTSHSWFLISEIYLLYNKSFIDHWFSQDD